MLTINNVFNNFRVQFKDSDCRNVQYAPKRILTNDVFEKSNISFGENEKLGTSALTDTRKKYWSEVITDAVLAKPDKLYNYLVKLSRESTDAKEFAFRTVTFLLNETLEKSATPFENLANYLIIYRSLENRPYIRKFDSRAINKLYDKASDLLRSAPITSPMLEDTIKSLEIFKNDMEDYAKSQDACNRLKGINDELKTWMFTAADYALKGQMNTLDVLNMLDDLPQGAKKAVFTKMLYMLSKTFDKQEDPLAAFDKFFEIYQDGDNRPLNKTEKKINWQILFDKLYVYTKKIDDGYDRIKKLEEIAKDQAQKVEREVQQPNETKKKLPVVANKKLSPVKNNKKQTKKVIRPEDKESFVPNDRKDYLCAICKAAEESQLPLPDLMDKLEECSYYERIWIFKAVLRMLNTNLRTPEAVKKFLALYGTEENIPKAYIKYYEPLKELENNLKADYEQNPSEEIKDLIDKTGEFSKLMIENDPNIHKGTISKTRKDELFKLGKAVDRKEMSLADFMTEMEQCPPQECRWVFLGVLRQFYYNSKADESTLNALEKFVNIYGKPENIPPHYEKYSEYIHALIYFVDSHFDDYPDQERVSYVVNKLRSLPGIINENKKEITQMKDENLLRILEPKIKMTPIQLSAPQQRSVDAYVDELQKLTENFSDDSITFRDFVKTISKESEGVQIYLFKPLLKSLAQCKKADKHINEAAFRFAEIYWHCDHGQLGINNKDITNLENLRKHIDTLDANCAVKVDNEGTIDPPRTAYRLSEMIELMCDNLGYPGSKRDVPYFSKKVVEACHGASDFVDLLDRIEQFPNVLPSCAITKKILFKHVVNRMSSEILKLDDPLEIETLVNYFSYCYQDKNIRPEVIDETVMKNIDYVKSIYYRKVPQELQSEEVNQIFEDIVRDVKNKFENQQE